MAYAGWKKGIPGALKKKKPINELKKKRG